MSCTADTLDAERHMDGTWGGWVLTESVAYQ